MFTQSSQDAGSPRKLKWLTVVLLLLWASVSFGVIYKARELTFMWGNWPFSFWMTAQGSVLVFLAITVIYAVLANRWDPASNRQDLEEDRGADTDHT